MREAAVAARTEAAHKRQVEAVTKLAGEDRAAELSALTGPQRYPEYARVLQAEAVADILEVLEELAGNGENSRYPAKRSEGGAKRDSAKRDSEAGDSEEIEEARRNPEPRHADLTFLTDEQVNALSDAGFDTLPAIQEASDDELEAVPHVGKATIKKIREAFGGAKRDSAKRDSEAGGE